MRITHSARRINAITDKFVKSTYLEIGVHEGITFLGVDADRKVAVDPYFRFDTFAHGKDGKNDFFECTSDYFFSDIQKKIDITPDVIFLDGMHTFQQTLRDLLNCLAITHSESVIIVDDVFPVDVYSSLPSSADAHRFRARAGGDSLAWHGDVYKVVMFVHDFIPSLSYCTISSGGNPQTVLWKEPRMDFEPVFRSIEEVERMNFFDLLKQENLLNSVSEQEGLSRVFEFLSSSED